MNRICASVSSAVLFLTTALFCGFFSISSFLYICQCFIIKENCGPLLLVCLTFTALTVLFVWSANRYGCLIWYENGVVKRRGLFFGFERDVPVTSIRAVETCVFLHQGTYYILIDDSAKPYSYILKNSSICFRDTKRSTIFVRSFWCGEITERMDG